MKVFGQASRHRSVLVAAVVTTALLLGRSAVGVSPMLAASPATIVDVQAESATLLPGAIHTLTATVYDAQGDLAAGPGADSNVRFWFQAGSVNDPGTPGNSPDLACNTGEAGWCTVGYVGTMRERTRSAAASQDRASCAPRP